MAPARSGAFHVSGAAKDEALGAGCEPLDCFS